MDHLNNSEAQKRQRSEDDGGDATYPSKRLTDQASFDHGVIMDQP